MSARIIPFQARTQNARKSEAAFANSNQVQSTSAESSSGPRKLHLVQPGTRLIRPWRKSQQQAASIVHSVKQQNQERAAATVPAVLNERSPQFWAALPVPETPMETPLTVARRLMHLLLSSA